ncbi:MAG: type II toxin-antitoxin system RelE/ParE family toxin [Reyranella sp.]|uniref:type II toxin-antitoxin system RelE/ParE family toxin n=1 Tax=Reyranella sp. TaxID=1929291 RepID=UPI001ACE1D8E|nr:type II toxin-antitoxin system RelE/ParE family toxin [Reyranella sp.]MBN9090458.1 type II toxin-antitoxin system RelE/ParE family toxin [Reyranella sp.]
MRLFKTKPFARFAAKESIPDSVLRDAIRRAEGGLIDADLGGGVIKQRLARPGQGKSGGFRSIVLFRRQATAFFVYGFAKNDRDNIDRQELSAFRSLASEMLAMDEKALIAALKNGTIMEIESNG